jgi:hypothetical protein
MKNMGWLWFSTVLMAAAAVLLLIRRVVGPRRLKTRIAYPLAVAERAVADALDELMAAHRARDDDGEDDAVFVNAFEPVVLRLAALHRAEVAALGREAALTHERLLLAIRTWNATAGQVERRESLLPTILLAHQAAQELSRHIEERQLSAARDEANHRVLHALVGPRDHGDWVQ